MKDLIVHVFVESGTVITKLLQRPEQVLYLADAFLVFDHMINQFEDLLVIKVISVDSTLLFLK